MARLNNAIDFGAGFNISAGSPIDSRARVEYENDLITGSTWPSDKAPLYNGLTTTVMDTGDIWVLVDKTKYTDKTTGEGWKKIGGANYTEGDNIQISGNSISALGYKYNEGRKSFSTNKSDAGGEYSFAEGVGESVEIPIDLVIDHANFLTASVFYNSTGLPFTYQSTSYTARTGDVVVYYHANNNKYYYGKITNFSNDGGYAVISFSPAIDITIDQSELSPYLSLVLYGAAGDCSHSEGSGTTSSGVASHSEGLYTLSNGNYSHSEGRGTITNNEGEHAEGTYNVTGTKSSLVEGSIRGDGPSWYMSNGTGEGEIGNVYELYINNELWGIYTVVDFVNKDDEYTVEPISGIYGYPEPFDTDNDGTYAKKPNSSYTMHSIGIGSDNNNRKNAVQVFSDGEVYINGIGNYTGTSVDNTVKSLKEAFVDKQDKLTAGSNIQINGNTISASDTNTHRPISVNGSQVLGNNTTALNLRSGTDISITADGSGNVTITNTGGGGGGGGTTYTAGENIIINGTEISAEGYVYDENHTRFNAKGSNAIGNYSFAEGKGREIQLPIDLAAYYTAFLTSANFYNSNELPFTYNNVSYTARTGDIVVYCHFANHKKYYNIIGNFSNNNGYAVVEFSPGIDPSIVADPSFLTPELSLVLYGAVGDCSHSEGSGTTANGMASHAEGWQTLIITGATGSHVEGGNAVVYGTYSHAEGINTFVYGENGSGLKAVSRYNSKAIRVDNSPSGIFKIGDIAIINGKRFHVTYIGSGPPYLSFEEDVSNDDVSWAQNNIIKKTVSNSAAHAEGSGTTAVGNASHAEGWDTKATGNASHAEGRDSTASGDYSHAEGFNTKASAENSHSEGAATVASGQYSHSEGRGSKASGYWSHAEGYEVVASGSCSHAEGFFTSACTSYSHAEGGYTVASGTSSHAEGYNAKATGNYSHAEGSGTTASANFSHAGGLGTVADVSGMTAIGVFNKQSMNDDLFSVGDGTDTSNRWNAFTVHRTHHDSIDKDYTASATVNGYRNVNLGMPIGSIVMWGGAGYSLSSQRYDLPYGWRLCNGDTISVVAGTSSDYDLIITSGSSNYYYKDADGLRSYSRLLSVIRDTYGYVGTYPSAITAFKLPNLQYKFPIGAVPGGTPPGTTGGTSSVTLTASQSGLRNHSHTMNFLEPQLATSNPSRVKVPSSVTTYNPGNFVTRMAWERSGGGMINEISELYDNNDVVSSKSRKIINDSESLDATQPHNNMPPYLALNFIIKYQ